MKAGRYRYMLSRKKIFSFTFDPVNVIPHLVCSSSPCTHLLGISFHPMVLNMRRGIYSFRFLLSSSIFTGMRMDLGGSTGAVMSGSDQCCDDLRQASDQGTYIFRILLVGEE